MGIAEELGQKQFKSVHQKAHLNIMFTAYWLIEQTKEVLKPFDITQQQFNVLKILKGRYPKSCASNEIKEVMIDKGPDLTRMIDRLVVKGWVTREVCPENRRKLDITITESGLALIKRIEPKLNKQFIDQTRISDKEASELSRILDKMRA
ncbi:MarR family transcriptional regulator [Reichenbachiella sp.]|uniref:MarR family winged helix-turn-helix transcriptional regulator n=1 Tax=Reichenbachiella sp. TaxID=2184521 RepID=UPI003298A958